MAALLLTVARAGRGLSNDLTSILASAVKSDLEFRYRSRRRDDASMPRENP